MSWSKAIEKPATEFQLTKLDVFEGQIPADLKGSLYRNGPGRLERGGEKMTHWFDGDGAILGVHIKDGEASGVYKYVKAKEYLEEEKKGKFLYKSHDYKPGFLTRIFRKNHQKNTGNTSVLPLPGKLLALWEGGFPHAMEPKNLETIGLDDLGFMKRGMTFSAHPKVDPKTGDIYNLGMMWGKKTDLITYRCDKSGNLIKMGRAPLRNPNMIHDCVLAGRYFIIMNLPTHFSILSYLLGASFHEALSWKPELGTEFYVFDKESMQLVSQFKIDEAFYSFHFANGYEDTDGSVYFEFVKHKDYLSFDMTLSQYPSGKILTDKFVQGKLNYIRIDPIRGKLLEMKELTSAGCEFPTVADDLVGEKWRYTMIACHTEKDGDGMGEMFRSIGRYDRETKKFTSYSFGKGKYVSEPILVSSKEDPEEGYILTMVFNSDLVRSELWIHETSTLEQGPLCKIALPSIVPPGFHGKWSTLEV